MKISLVSLSVPLIASILLLLPSDVGAQRDIPTERRKRETFVLNATHSVIAYRTGDNDVVITRLFPQNNAGKKTEVKGTIVPSTMNCKLGPNGKPVHGSNQRHAAGKRATIDCSKHRPKRRFFSQPGLPKGRMGPFGKRHPDADFYFDTPQKLRKICAICMALLNVSSVDCYKGQDGARTRCHLLVRDMPNMFARTWNQEPVDVKKRLAKVEDYFTGPENLRKICELCGTLFKVNPLDCFTSRKGARNQCRDFVKEMPNTVEHGWNELPVE